MDRELREKLDEYGVTIVEKGEWQSWHHYIIPIFMWVVGFFNPSFKSWFYNSAVNVFGSTIYMPDLERFEENPGSFERVIRHELVHIMDWKERPVWFPISYVISRKMRAFWEYRGYTQNIIHRYETAGYVSSAYLRTIARNFEGSNYFWMDRDPMPVLNAIREKVEDEEITGFDNETLNETIRKNRT